MWRKLSATVQREVPRPEQWEQIIITTHEKTGDFGRHRTIHLLLQTYWWKGLYRDWHVDLAGPFKASRGGGRYVILAVEAFTKLTVFGIMSDKEPVSTARFFNRQIIPVFGDYHS